MTPSCGCRGWHALLNKKISLFDNPIENKNKFSSLSNNNYKGNLFLKNKLKSDTSVIGENHYIQSGSKSYDFPEENLNNFINKNNNLNYSTNETKFNSISNNDPRFASISSELIENNEYKDDYTFSSKIVSFFGSALEVSKTVASTVKEKVSDMDFGKKLFYVGGKTADVLYNTSSTLYEKSYEIAVILKIFKNL